MSEQHLTDKPFSDFDLPEPLLRGVEAAGFRFCTPIQAEALPIILAGRDVEGQAQTGTGKSAAFLLATFRHLMSREPVAGAGPGPAPRAVILAPTRELAIQIHEDAKVLGRFTDFRLCLVYGGTGYDSQRQALQEGVDVLIGTPGRIIDYFKQKVFRLNGVQVMVLDEADRMFDLGFIKDIRYLLRRMPPPEERLNMLFSATLSYRVNELAYEHMNNPVAVNIAPDKKTADKVSQRMYHTANEEKIPLLIGLLQHMDPSRTMVFTNTKRAAEKVQAWLEGNGLHAAMISGDVPQKKRQQLLADFKEGRLAILVATDVAARGLHVPDVSHVINFDLPQDPEDYVHRIGRTARAGASGEAISFACENYAYSLLDIEEYLGHKIPVAAIGEDLLPGELKSPVRRPRRPRDARGRNGRRDGRPRRAAPGRASGSGRRERRKPASPEGKKAPAPRRRPPKAGGGPAIG